jgi:hypothetical protein
LQKNGNLILKGDDTELIKEDFFKTSSYLSSFGINTAPVPVERRGLNPTAICMRDMIPEPVEVLFVQCGLQGAHVLQDIL